MPKKSETKLSHYDTAGNARMVDVSAKQTTKRTATASAFIELSAAVLAALPTNPKGNPLEVARFAGIQAAKRTSELIPMCHPLPLTHVDVEADIVAGGVRIHATVIHHRPNGSRDGSPHRRVRRRPHRLRYDQGARQIHRHSQHPVRREIRRKIRRLQTQKIKRFSSRRPSQQLRTTNISIIPSVALAPDRPLPRAAPE